MVFPVVGGTQDTSYEISNSLRFNDDDDAVLDRGSISGTLSKAHTFSLWVKRSTLDDARHVLAGMGDGSGNISWIEFNANSIRYFGDGAGNYAPQTTAKYRDVSAWYHIVVKVDTTQSSASDRLKIYVNGTEQAYSGTPPPQNHQADMDECTVGFNPGDEFDGYMAEFHFLDGVAYDPTYFGQTDINGVWIPKEYTGGNYGTFGFYLQFKQTGTSANSSGMGADTSGNDNHFSATNLAATDVTVDTPTNNFSTLNPLSPTSGNPVYAEGNLKISASGTDAYSYFPSTFGLSNGKWYAEVKVNSQGGNTFIGIAETSMEAYNTGANNDPHLTAGTIWYANGGNGYYDGSAQDASTFGAASFTSGDIIGLALDLDSGTKTIKFYKNGSLTATKNLTSNFVDPIVFAANLFNTQNQSWNFGNPDFSISSGNADANGYGNFEYAPPSGYYACCTKNLAEFG